MFRSIMAERKTYGILPQVGTHSNGESHSSNQEDMPVDSGGGNSQLNVQEHLQVDTNTERETSLDVYGGRPPYSPQYDPDRVRDRSSDSEDLEYPWIARAALPDVSDTEESSLSSHNSGETSPSCHTSDDDVEYTVLTAKEYKQFLKEGKLAEGTWLPNNRLRKKKHKQFLKERNLTEGIWLPIKKLWKKKMESIQETTSGVSHLKRSGTSGSSKPLTPPVKKPKLSTEAATSSAGGTTNRDQLAGRKLAVAPAYYPDVRFSPEECETLQDKIFDLVVGEDGTECTLQFVKMYHEKGALVVTCGNDETVEWLKRAGPGLMLGGEGTEVIVADYSNLIRTTKVLLRTDRRLAAMDPTRVLVQVERQNPGVTTRDWRIVGRKRKDDHQTLVLVIDEVSALFLKDCGWKVFLGLGQYQLRVKSGAPDDPVPSC